MLARLILVGAAAAAAVLVGVSVLRTVTPSQPTPRPTAAAAPSPTPRPTANAPAGATPPPSPSPSPTLPPGAVSCPSQEGGEERHQTQLVAVRVAHQSGFDRVVFELGPASIGSYGIPRWHVRQSGEFRNTAGQPVAVTGNAFLQVRISGTSMVQADGRTMTYTGPTDIRPATPLVRNLRFVEDFERQIIWGIGLERLQCPRVLELTDPVRLVLDLPSTP